MARCFCHLHLHTHYSLLDGFNRIPPLVEQTKKLGMTAVSITDHGNLYGAIEFYSECKKGGIKPIIGYEAYLAPNSRRDRDSKHELGHATHLTLLAKNNAGFKNLVKLSSIAYLEGFYRNPRIDREILEAHKEGLICLSGCLAGEFNQYIAKGKHDEAAKTAKWFRKVFGEDFYIEIQNNGIGLQDECTPVAADIAQKLGVPLVATADAHYLCSEDARAHDVLFCINTRQMHDPRKKKYPEERMPNPYFVRSPDDMYRLFPGYEDAVARSQQIADGVDIDIDFKKRYFPVFDPPGAKTPAEYLRELCEKGMYERYGENPSEAVRKRLEHELGIITKMGFETYFLVVWDFVRYAREVGIPCTARGSGCGAMACYVLYLSHVCPLEYDLLFERFLDPNRSEAPDIDIDFCQERRELVIDYVKRKYGEQSVAQIGTFGTLAAKAALKDVGRALDVPLDRVNFMCKLVPMKGAIAKSLQEALDESPDFRREYDQDPQIREMVDLALKLEGTNRNVGTHAAGVVIANGPITNYVPVQRPPKKGGEDNPDASTTMTTQWEMGIIEKVGLLKMDFLGLRNLTVLDNCVKLIKRTRGEDIDPMKFPLDDRATYDLLQRGDAKGVFQLESEGIRELLKRMKPDNIRDLIAVLALYRPGPLEGGMVDEYVECKHGRRQPQYPHPVMEEVLGETYGVMCIHEDARVAMADGTEKPIKHVRRFDRVHSLNLETRQIEVKECHGCGPTRRGTGLRLTLENGFSVLLTPDHKVWTWEGWKEVQDLDPRRDLVACGVNTPQELPEVASLAPWLGADEDVAYLLGLLTGDGCLTSTGITVATGTEEAHGKLAAWLRDRFPELKVSEYFHLRSWYVNLSHPELLDDPAHGNRKTRFHHLVESLGLKTKAPAKRVPEVIFRCPAPVRGAYLAGVLDSDGCVATNAKGAGVCFVTSPSPELLQDLRRLCQLIGVTVKLYPQRLQVWNLKGLRAEVESYMVVKRFPERCGDGSTVGWVPREEVFAAVSEGESRRAFAARTGLQARSLAHDFPFVKSSTARKAGIELGDARFYLITRIEEVADQQFYGMSVEDHHNLLANGLIVKNCYQEQIMRILNRLGGIELAKAYACIKAISKKKTEIIEERKADFIKGAEERGLPREKSDEIFGLIEKFGGYGFNKCLNQSAKVVNAETGETATVGELFARRRPFTVHALGADEKLARRAVTDVVWNGRKRVYRLTTELGKSITATANHPFRTLGGWTNLGDLKPGDRIAAPRRLPIPTTESWPRHELIALAGLLSEGNTCHPTTLYFYGNDRVLVEDFASAVKQFPDTIAKVYTRPDGRRLEVQANTGRDARFKPKAAERESGGTAVLAPPARSGAFLWAKRLGILGKTATEKFVPRGVFRLRDADIELFLGRLWAGDGFIANDTFKVPFYATSSRQLAGDVQHLLLRLGIVSRVHAKQFKYKGGLKPGFTVHILGDGAAETFLERIALYCVGREAAVGVLREHVAATARGQTSKDTVPLEVRAWVDEERTARGLTWEELERQSGVSTQEFYGTPAAGKRGFRRSTIAKLAAFFGSQRLAHLAESDVFWDRVVSVEYVGVEDTYDLTVEEDHNFVANGLIVHNSHTAAYAQIGYQTAYLKAHYTAEYMAALLSSEIDDGNKRDVFIDHIADARKLGIDVLPPDVNRGMADFDVVNNRIIFGLTAIKGLGRAAALEVVRAREAGGAFRDLFDFCERVDRRVVQKAAVEKMIQAGAFDAFGRRSAQFAAVTKAYQSADERAAEKRRGQKSFLDLFEGDGGGDDSGERTNHGLPDVPEWPETERLKFEKEALDFYISSHPLAQHDDQLRRFRTHDAGPLAKNGKNGTQAQVGGMITNLDIRTANKGRNVGRKYAMFRVEDFTGSVRCIMWSDEYSRFKEVVGPDFVGLFEGVLNWGEGRAEPDFQIKKVTTIEEARAEFTKSMVLKVPYTEDEEALRKLDAVSLVLKRYRGACPVYLSVRDMSGKQVQMKLNDEFRVNPAVLKLEELEMLLGQGAVIFSR